MQQNPVQSKSHSLYFECREGNKRMNIEQDLRRILFTPRHRRPTLQFNEYAKWKFRQLCCAALLPCRLASYDAQNNSL